MLKMLSYWSTSDISCCIWWSIKCHFNSVNNSVNKCCTGVHYL